MLSQRGCDEDRIFLDTHSLHEGDFKRRIENSIEESQNIIIVVSKDCFESKSENDEDFFINEIKAALDKQKKIIPVFFDDIKGFDECNMPNEISRLKSYNAIIYQHEYADAVFTKLISFINNDVNRTTTTGYGSKKLKSFLYPFIALVCAAVCIGLLFFPKDFRYNKNGIETHIKNLSPNKSDVLTEILDNMVLVNGGTFQMGNTQKGNHYRTDLDKHSDINREVSLSNYYISKYEITQKQWGTFKDINNNAKQLGERLPIDYISWQDAKDFIDMLRETTGLAFALPTEAQWEFAARGGNLSNNYIYSGSDYAEDVGWISALDTLLHKVGELAPNELGLYDMTGNVAEWCNDIFGEYRTGPEHNPTGTKNGNLRVVRGGNISSEIYESKSTTRWGFYPNYKRMHTGLRLVINIE